MSTRRAVLRAGLAGLGAVAGAHAARGSGPVTVDILEYRFVPETVVVKVGTTVRWTNSEKRASHSVRFIGEGGFESERLMPGDVWEHRFERVGHHPYVCGPHPTMTATVVVTD